MTMKRLHDSSQISIAGRSSMSSVAGRNFITLAVDDASQHLRGLEHMFGHAIALFEQQVIPSYQSHGELIRFVKNLQSITAVLEKRISRKKFLEQEDLELSIDPTESGLPVFIRDLHFLNGERKRALDALKEMPDDKQLVDDALFSLFRGVLPLDIIDLKMLKNIYQRLSTIPAMQELRFHDAVLLGEDKECQLYSICVERLEETYNIPRFYTIHFRVPNFSTWDESLASQFKTAFLNCTQMRVDTELKSMAREIESINGVSVNQIQRVDIGPFYNRFTQNSESINELLNSGLVDDCIFTFKVHSTHRVSEKKVQGFANWFKALASGDWHSGSFSKTLVSPAYVIMPHRLIQKAHHYNVKLDNHVKMFGLSAQGGLIESAEQPG